MLFVELQLKMKNILELVVPHVTQKWKELGIILLQKGKDPVAQLEAIRADHPSNNRTCCLNMFQFWLETDTTASWEQLITALCSNGVDLANVAEDLKKTLSGRYVKCYSSKATSVLKGMTM